MGALLQAFGLGLGAAVYVLAALSLVRGLRNTARGSVGLYSRLRDEAEARAQVARVDELRARRDEREQRRMRTAA